MKFDQMTTEERAELLDTQSQIQAEEQARADEKASRMARRESRLQDLPGNAGLDDLRERVQALVDEVREL